MRKLFLLWALVLLAAKGVAAKPAPDDGLPVLRDVPRFSFLDQDGRRFTRGDLAGKTWIADFIFTQCRSICPTLTAQMKLVQRSLGGHDVRIVSFSVDPDNDDPAALRAYAARWSLDGARWRLLDTRDVPTLRKFTEAMAVDFFQTGGPGGPAHTDRFFLIDAKGRVRASYDSTSRAEMDRLAADAGRLADAGGKPEAATAAAEANGRELAMSLGCMSCHRTAELAPPLEGVAGSTVDFHGTGIFADDAYLRESILDPGAKIVPGYSETMPSYRGHLTPAQLDALVDYLNSIGRSSTKPSPTSTRIAAVDPVCGMALSAGEETPKLVRLGKTFYFCSDKCRRHFERDPARYTGR